MITGPDLHRLRHSLQLAADEAQMKSGAKREVLLVSLQEAKDILDALSELVDRRSESAPRPSSTPLTLRAGLTSIRNRALERRDATDINVATILDLVDSLEDE